jgi:hypothetical protein
MGRDTILKKDAGETYRCRCKAWQDSNDSEREFHVSFVDFANLGDQELL